MSEKLEFDLSVKGGKNNDLSAALADATKRAFDLESALVTAVGVFGGNVFTKAFSALKNGLTSAVEDSVSFKRAQLEIETILPKNTKLTAAMVKELENLSVAYGTTATAQAKSYYQVISAGVNDAAKASALLAQANVLASGGLASTAGSIDLLTTIYNVYGAEIASTAEATDSLFKTVQIGKTTVEQLTSSLGQAVPIAKSLGIGLDEVGAVIAQLTNAGFQTSESVTLLDAVLTAIARNGEKLGPTMNSAAVQVDGLGVVLERIKEKTNGSNDALFALLGRQEAVKGVTALTAKGLEHYNSILAEYSNKAGVASAASKKIIEGDLSKQWDILTESIARNTRHLVDSFIPAALSATKAVNDIFGNVKTESEINEQLNATRKHIEVLNKAYELGNISLESYEGRVAQATEKLKELSNAAETASSPLVTLKTGLEKDAASIKLEIASIKNGFDSLSLGPIERNLKVNELTAKLDAVNAKLIEINKTSSEPVKIAPSERDKQAVENEARLQADLAAVRANFAVTQQTFDDQLFLAQMEKESTRGELITQAIYDQKIREADAAYEGELIKNALIKDAQEQAAANALSLEKQQEAKISAARNKVITDETNFKKGQIELEKSFQNSRNTLIGQGFQLAATLAKDGSSTQFLIQKAAALAEIAIADGKARALIPAQTALIPFPANIGAAASLNAYVTAQTALGSAIVAASAIKGFANGGIVGATDGPDNRVATIREGELILNAAQQKKLYDSINSGNIGGGDIVVQIDGREIARAIRDQIQGGFRLA